MNTKNSASKAKEAVRIDRWLWAARFYKTRAMATDAVKKGHVYVNGLRTKPAKAVKLSDELRIRKNQSEWVVLIKGLSAKRLGAPLARELYSETADSIDTRNQQAAQRKLLSQGLRHSRGKPNKKDRRDLIKHKYQ